MEASIIYPVSFDIDRFRTGAITFSRGNDYNNYTSEIPKWSVTKVFEILSNRFWADLKQNF